MKAKPKNKYFITSIILLLFISLNVSAARESSLNEMVTSITMGPDDFGWNTAPAGTSFIFHNDINLIPEYMHKGYFKLAFSFKYLTNKDGDYHLSSGTPRWSQKYHVTANDPYYNRFSYFYPTSYIDIYLRQGFLSNPLNQTAPLIYLSAGFFSDYSMCVENIRASNGQPPYFVNSDGTHKAPFGPGQWIQATPWLSDNRINWVNYIYLTSSLNLIKPVGFQTSDGLSMDLGMELGPKWMLNTFSGEFPSSDYYKVWMSMTENLTLYESRQDNGYNWLSISLSHYNSISSTFGSIIPHNKVPGHRLLNNLQDSISIQFNGPQFFSPDCYSFIRLSLNNTLRWGKVANERPQTTQAVELSTDFSSTFYMRLFGFLRFEFNTYYNIINGISTSVPRWSNKATIRIFVQI